MEKRNRILLASAALTVTILSSLLASTTFPTSEAGALGTKQDALGDGAPVWIPGVVFTGKFIRIGLNKGGTFGVGKDDPGTGFQYPIGPQFESLAQLWWGEGYAIFYKKKTATGWVDKVAYYWPNMGWPIPKVCKLKLVSAAVKRNDKQGAIYQVVVKTLDGLLHIRFRFWFPKQQKYVILETQIKNLGGTTLRDVLYKRYVDWDIHGIYYENLWTSDSHSAYAHYLNRDLGKNIEMSVSGYTNPATGLPPSVLPAYVDLQAWDDLGPYPPEGPPARDSGEEDVQSHEDSLLIDGNAAIYFDLGYLASKKIKRTYLVYQTGWYSPDWIPA